MYSVPSRICSTLSSPFFSALGVSICGLHMYVPAFHLSAVLSSLFIIKPSPFIYASETFVWMTHSHLGVLSQMLHETDSSIV
jgi:hypothetical protein